MSNVISVLGHSLISGLIPNTNLYVVYISLVVLFFLLGLVLGLNIETRRKISKEEKTHDTVNASDKTKQTFVTGQDNIENQKIYNTYQGHSHSKRRRHKHSSMHIQ
jgi:hypothetical protein